MLALAAGDVSGISAILCKYADQSLDFADATLMHLAGRESIKSVFTVDRRHFSLYRTATGEPLNLIPSPAPYESS